jgi:ElaB/YqjD/DUF883 family membrane-anchored ribosome-binding protein
MNQTSNDIIPATADAAHDTIDSAEHQANEAASKLAKLKDDVKTQADKALHAARDAATSAYDKAAAKARELADAAPEKAREAREQARKIAEDGTARVRTTVQEQPLAALGAGIALGFVVGWLLSRKD